MLRKVRAILFNEINKNALTLMYGTVLAQALPLIFSPWLARLYTPAQFGIFSLYYGISSILGNMSAGKMDLALYVSKNRQAAVATMISGMAITLAMTTLVTIGAIVVHLWGNVAAMPATVIYMIPVTVLFFGASQVLVAYSNREKKFSQLSRSKVLLGSTWVVVNIIFGYWAPSAEGLSLGYALGQILSCLYLLYINLDSIRAAHFNFKVFKYNLIRNKNYALIFLPSQVLNNLTTQGPSLFLSSLFNLNATGLYFKAARVGESPTYVVRNSLGNVFWQRASQQFIAEGSSRSLIKPFFIRLLVVGLPAYVFLYLFAEWIFVVLFGEPWREAAAYFKILTPCFLFQFTITPLTIMVVLSNKPWVDIAWQIMLALFVCTSFYVGWLMHDPKVALGIHSALMCLAYTILFAINYRYSVKR